MKDSNLIKRLLLALGIIWVPSVATADIIYFKDGMKTVCLEKAWEENGEVKCEYDGVVLSYRKEDVDRIEKRRTRQQAPKSEKKTTVGKMIVYRHHDSADDDPLGPRRQSAPLGLLATCTGRGLVVRGRTAERQIPVPHLHQ